MKNFEFRIMVSDSLYKIEEFFTIGKFDNESDEDYEKRAFKTLKDYRSLTDWEYCELRKYDLNDNDYIDWDMTNSKYYNFPVWAL